VFLGITLVLLWASLKSFHSPDMLGVLLSGVRSLVGVIGKRRGGAAKLQPLACRLGGAADLVHQAAQVRLLDHVEAAGSVLRRVVPGIEGLADEGAIAGAILILDLGHGDDLIDDSRQFQAGFGAIDLGLKDAPIEVVELLVEDPDEPDVLRARVLQVRKPGDHLAPVQAVGAAQVQLAGLIRKGFRLPLAPLKAQAAGDRDRVDEKRLIAVESIGIAKALTDSLVVRLAVSLIIAQGRVRAADEDGEVTAFLPGARTQGVALPALNGE